MSTTTPNFGWVVPTSSDLVKNGAVAIETLGDSIDASMVDLKGGTTGQVLSKTSNTDMDFTWTTASSGSGFAAGKNRIINGDFNINQRSFTSTTTNLAYGFDRFLISYAGGSLTYSTQAFTLGAAPVSGYEGKNFCRLVTASQSAAGDFAALIQRIESVRTFAGQTVTISMWAKASTGTPKIGISATQEFGTSGAPSASVIVNGGTATISTSWARYTFTVAIPSIAGKTITTGDSLGITFWTSVGTTISGLGYPAVGVQNVTIDTWGWQIEAGSTATDFVTASGNSPQGELAMCQRYYWRTANKEQRFGLCFSFNTTQAYGTITFPVQMRTSPAVMDTTGTAANYMVFIGATTYTNTSVPTIDIATPVNCSVGFANAGTMVAAGSGFMSTASAVSAYLGFSAEL